MALKRLYPVDINERDAQLYREYVETGSRRQSQNKSKTDTLCAVFYNTCTSSLLHPRSTQLQYPEFKPVLYLNG